VAPNFFYSFLEDADGNGRVDRIRAQAAFELMDAGDSSYGGGPAFSTLNVEVDGYEIDASRGAGGFGRGTVLENATDCLFIYLKEKDYSDTAALIRWRIVSNESLRDLATKSIELITESKDKTSAWIITTDTAPPRINYALTVPGAVFDRPGHASGMGEIYVQFSEPVDFEGSYDYISVPPYQTPYVPIGVVGTGIPAPTITADADLSDGTEIIIPLSSAYSVADLAPAPLNFTISHIQDRAEYAEDMRSATDVQYAYQYPSPKYPDDWTYGHYTEVRGNPAKNIPFTVAPSASLPPGTFPRIPRNKMDGTPPGEQVRRVTDMLISVPPLNVGDAQYFVWPLWAKYDTSPFDGSVLPDPNDTLGAFVNAGYGYMSPNSNSPYNDRDIIWDFSGKRFLEASSIASGRKYDTTMQVRHGNGAVLPDSLKYAFNVNADLFKARSRDGGTGHGSTGLWIPDGAADFANMVPRFMSVTDGLQTKTGTSPSGNLYNFNFIVGGPDGYEDKKVLEFFLHLTGSPLDLFAARLDIPAGTAVPNDWYYRIKPFSFGIHNITRQRNSATILNNVINPVKGERVYLDYTIGSSGPVTIQVFTLDGNLVQVLERGNKSAGNYRVSWDGKNRGGRAVARGMYFIRIVAPGVDEIRKVMVVK
jgi:hypothetical protein